MPSQPQQQHTRVLSFNVNGLRALLRDRLKLTLSQFLISLNADIVCMQETKLRRCDIDRDLAIVDGWDAFFSCSQSATGYSGTATYVRTAVALPFASEEGFTGCAALAAAMAGTTAGSHNGAATMAEPHPALADQYTVEELAELDGEGRVTVTDHGAFVLFNIYGPAITKQEVAEDRMQYKLRFFSALELRWRDLLRQGRAVVAVGDLNICPTPLDYPVADLQFFRPSRPDRLWLRRLLHGSTTTGGSNSGGGGGDQSPPAAAAAAAGSNGNGVAGIYGAGASSSNGGSGGILVDTFRAFHPTRQNAFTCWSTATSARVNNYGSRIDLVLTAGISVGNPPPSPSTAAVAAAAAAAADDEAPPAARRWHREAASPPGAMRFAFKGSQLKLHSWLQRGESAAQLLNSDPAASSSNGSQLLHGLSTAEQQQQQQTAATRPPGNHASCSSQLQAAASGLGSPRVAAASGGGSGSASGAGAAVGKKQANLKSLFKRQQQGTQPVQLEQQQQQQQQQPVPPPWGSQQPPSQQSQQQQGEAGPNATSDFFAAELAASTASRQQSPEAAKDAWRTIQQRFQVPQCPGHREPAVLKKVNKSGPNKGNAAGRYFYTCARPDGPKPHGKCEFFKRLRANVTREEMFFNHRPLDLPQSHDLPTNFSWNDPNNTGVSMLVPSWNQHIPQYCGSCWLHGTTSMIQDRLKIVKGGIGPDTMLARQVVLNCGAFHGYGQGCGGGDVIDVLRYMAHFGLPDESCQPFSADDHTKYGRHARKCPADGYCTNCMPLKGRDTCWSVHTPVRYYLSAFGKLEEPGELSMMNEIFHRGPITCSMATPEVFDYGLHTSVDVYPSNISDPSEIDHDVEVVGWGQEEGEHGLKYWVIRNSWGTYWGEMGFFKMQRGVNALQLEAGDCWYAIPTWEDEQAVRSGEKISSYLTRHSSEQLQRSVMAFCQAVNAHDLDKLHSYLSPKCVWSDRVWSSVDLVGAAKVAKVYKETWRSYPDYTLHTEDVLARDDSNTVAVHFTATGTCFGEWRGHPASGRRSTFSGVSLFVFDSERDDLIQQIITYRQPSSEEYAFYVGHEDL
ncbi:hypothetical protein CHLNCDRAFT_136485 [Chlorella variabilis]|uniref:DNA-(apurinic or apyrimidinic site) endonuclease 2 n=1 Tax=Chlorella variabilis TaxID=554065 RepID=E1ZKF9_CHLVA|nr:hypothetical protein CHLNCDRAFT_136485 [Chlorella variabilis]EFN53799.1 hypothetical protein CHLNCDRAFT_136485 [Chlorella variabilis]|eukprot:XP_005845901.1 hypothetical protein CHLNCDRAFT_136485 [Chlorella variabilis]